MAAVESFMPNGSWFPALASGASPRVASPAWLGLGALGRGGDLLPLRPGSQPGSAVLPRDAQRVVTEEQPQRRVVAVHEGQDGVTGGHRVAGRGEPLGPGLRRRVPDAVVGGPRR